MEDVEVGGNEEQLDWVASPSAAGLAAERPAAGTASEESSSLLAKPPAASTSSAPTEQDLFKTPNSILCTCLSLQQYFDVDTVDVQNRIKAVFAPKPGTVLLDTIGEKPDLYGPLWIAITLVFVVGATANVSSWVASPEGAAWRYDLSLMTGSAGLIAGFTMLVPFGMWIAARYLGQPILLVKTMCLYGYSVSPFIPMALLCTTPILILDWVAMVAGVGLSARLLVSNLEAVVSTQPEKQQKIIKASIVGTQVLFGLILKLFFFRQLHT